MKVWSLIPIIPIIITCLVNQNYGQEIEELNRVERAASKDPNTAPNPGNQQSKPSVSEVSSRHMKLGRIMNAVYLQTQLANKKIDYYDVIAGIWNLKDKTVIDKLVSLKIDGLSVLLTNLETAINGVPDGVNQIVDVETLNQKLASVKEITPDMREALVEASKKEAIPTSIGHDFASFGLDENLAQKSVDSFSKFKEIDSSTYRTSDIKPFLTTVENIREALDRLPQLLEQVNQDKEKNLNSLLNGLRAATKAKEKSTDFQSLFTQLTSMNAELDKLQSVKSVAETAKTDEKLRTVQQLVKSVNEPPSNMSIASAFISSHNLSQVFSDLKENWLIGVLSNGKGDLKSLETPIGGVKTFSDKFSSVDKYQDQLLKMEYFGSMSVVSDFIQVLINFQEHPEIPNFSPTQPCFQIAAEPAPEESELLALSTDMEQFQVAIPKIQEKLNTVPKDIVQKCVEFEKKISSLRKVTDYEEFLNSTDIGELSDFLEGLVTKLAELQLAPEVFQSIQRLSSAKPKLQSAQKWIQEFKIGGQKCDALFNFQTEKLAGLNSVPRSVKMMKTAKLISKLQPLLETIPKLSSDLQKLKEPAPPKQAPTATTSQPKAPQKGKRSSDSDSNEDVSQKLSVKNPQSLLDVAFAARSLEQMSELSQLDDVIKTFSEDGKKMSGIIKKWPNSKTKQDMEKIWSEFPGVDGKVKSLQEKIKSALATMTSSVPEKSLKEVGDVYSKLSSIQMSEKIELREMRESMSVFEVFNPNFRKENSKLIDALEKLDKPISMDWGMAFSSFQKVPNALIELQVDFETFFTGNGGNGGGGEESFDFGKWCNDNPGTAGGIGAFILVVVGALAIWLVYRYCCCCKRKSKKPLPNDKDVENGGKKRKPKGDSNNKNSKSKENESKNSKSKESTSLEGQKNQSTGATGPSKGGSTEVAPPPKGTSTGATGPSKGGSTEVAPPPKGTSTGATGPSKGGSTEVAPPPKGTSTGATGPSKGGSTEETKTAKKG